jgi:hypothetical protein
MKNTVKIIGILAFLALFAFSFTACSEDTGDPRDLKVGGISSTHNGKYVTGIGYSGSTAIVACAEWDFTGAKIKGALVEGGNADLTVYTTTTTGIEVYKGNDTVSMTLYVSSTEEVNYGGSWGTSIGSQSVSFKDGVGEFKF